MDMRGMMEEFEKVERELEARRARRAPAANRMTKVMSAPMSYRYWYAGQTKRGRVVRFCVSNFCNVAGYFLVWREMFNKQGTRTRTQWSAMKDPSAAIRLVKRRVEAFTKKQGKE